jgi:glycosyltransferase involved in cell wall biosynthesis
MKTSFITTVFNEEKNVGSILESIVEQTKLPDEVVIVDGGSTDGTVNKVREFIKSTKRKGTKVDFRLFEKRGNRSVGRNDAISKAKGDIILISDAGCFLDRKWVEEIVKPFNKASVDVVAGYYKGRAKNVFQQCLVPYVLVMPDRIDPNNFLPATRSMAIRKSVWKELGGFPEQYSYNEDYVFAQALKRHNKTIVFAKHAIVEWIPRNTLREAWTMFYRFALGDAEAGILRKKVLVLFLRYIVGIFLLILAIMRQEKILLLSLLVLLFFYCIWSVLKNYKYVQKLQAIVLLPLIQFTADFAVMDGTLRGLINRWGIKKTL